MNYLDQWKADNFWCEECKWTWNNDLNHQPGSDECLEAKAETEQ